MRKRKANLFGLQNDLARNLVNKVAAFEQGNEFGFVFGEDGRSCGAEIIVTDMVVVRSGRGNLAVLVGILHCKSNP